MNKFLSMAALALLVTSCTESNEEPIPDGKQIKAEMIRLTQSVEGIKTKAAIGNGSEVKATVLMVDAENSTANWSLFAAKVTNTPEADGSIKDGNRATVSLATFSAGTETNVSLAPDLYYPESKNAHLLGIAPKGAINGAKVDMATKDGLQDVMFAPSIDAGTSAVKSTPLTLAFTHKTTQLTFKTKLTAAAENGAWGGAATLKSITIVGAQLPAAVSFPSGDVEWTTAAPFIVPNISNAALSSTATKVGDAIMINSGGTVTINAIITANGKDVPYDNVVIKDGEGNLTSVIGSSHEITLTVTEPTAITGTTITATATVTPWQTGKAGTGELKD